jgi:predicted lysophospholipase L1 biosynthesis ABC-type transport system permease subunit
MSEPSTSSLSLEKSKPATKAGRARPKCACGSRAYANFRSAITSIWIYKRNSLLAASGVFSCGMVVLATDTVIRSTHALFALRLYMQVIKLLLISSNGIAFVSASLIMINGMYVAGMGRAWEFGMRLLVGARRRDILYQLLCEAFLLSVIGAVSGSVLGLLIGFVLTVLLQLPWVVQPVSLGLLISAAVISGTIGGLYPALKVAQQDFWET